MATDLDLAYFAGLIDGEGCIRVQKDKAYKHLTGRVNPAYKISIHVRMTDRASLDALQEILGGWMWAEPIRHEHRKPLYCWQATDNVAETIIRSLLPFMRVKRPAAENALALRDLQSERKKHRTKITGYRDFPHWTGKIIQVPNLAYSDEYIALCEDLYLRSRELNRVGA